MLDVTNACSAVLWEAPSNPKGNIIRYDIEIGNDIQMVPATRHFLLVEQSHKEANSLTRVRIDWVVIFIWFLHALFFPSIGKSGYRCRCWGVV